MSEKPVMGKVNTSPKTVTKKVLSSRQLVAIETLLATGSVHRTAIVAGVTVKTIYMWLKGKRFLEGVVHAERTMLTTIGLRLLTLANQASDTLEDGMSPNEDIKTRLRASEIFFTKALSWMEYVDMEERLRKVETQVMLRRGGTQ